MRGHEEAKARQVLAGVLGREADSLPLPEPLSLGMTNRSYLGTDGGQRYIIRLPGEGSAQLVDRQAEYASYQAVAGLGLTDDVLLLDPASGVKVTRFLPGVHNCDPQDPADLAPCMARLRAFHEMDLTVGHVFDPFSLLETYESFRGGAPSVYPDYPAVKQDVLSLRPWLSPPGLRRRLCHIDAVPDNFLLTPDRQVENVRLIDWEYAGMADPLIDLAMFAVYAGYEKDALERLIDLYDPGLNEAQRQRIFGWAAVCGLLWSNWCEFKAQLGVDFGDYARQQYRLAKYYYHLCKQEETT